MTKKAAVIKGDGTGPELVNAMLHVLKECNTQFMLLGHVTKGRISVDEKLPPSVVLGRSKSISCVPRGNMLE